MKDYAILENATLQETHLECLSPIFIFTLYPSQIVFSLWMLNYIIHIPYMDNFFFFWYLTWIQKLQEIIPE